MVHLSTKIHYCLNLIIVGGFKPFDYGSKKNMKLYNSPTPPDYNLSGISTPMAFYVGQNDLAAGPSVTYYLKIIKKFSFMFINHTCKNPEVFCKSVIIVNIN